MSIRRDLSDTRGPEPRLGARRRTVLEQLQGADDAVSVEEMAGRTGLHVNTARFHLDRLVESGHAERHAERHAEERGTPGRPRIRYAARPAAAEGPTSYRLLSAMLVGLVEKLGADTAAVVDVGRSWGRHLIGPEPPTTRVDAEEGLARVTTLMDDVGFAPETIPSAEPELHLHHCPFLEAAELDRQVVCGLHRGLIEGALDELAAPVRVLELEPFATPRTCVARLRRTDVSG